MLYVHTGSLTKCYKLQLTCIWSFLYDLHLTWSNDVGRKGSQQKLKNLLSKIRNLILKFYFSGRKGQIGEPGYTAAPYRKGAQGLPGESGYPGEDGRVGERGIEGN